MLKILIRGANDVASAAAHVLFKAEYFVMLHESAQPTTARRKMSFTDAVFDGEAILEDVVAKMVKAEEVLSARGYIPLCVDEFSALLECSQPDILIDARMRKHHQPETQRGLAPLVIGLGPNFIIGQNTDLGIETGWDSLGRIVLRGETNPLMGEPREIEGHARDRYVYAPVGGIFRAFFQIGDQVQSGEEIGRVDANPLLAPISGILRGATRDGVYVSPKTKIIEIDPRENGAQVAGIGERPAKIAQGVLQAVKTFSPRARI